MVFSHVYFQYEIDETLMKEVKDISSVSNPDETFYVVDSMTGQDAINSATEFIQCLQIPSMRKYLWFDLLEKELGA